MGLAIQVGVLADLLENDPQGAEWFREGFDAANRILSDHQLPLHTEPESLSMPRGRCSIDSFPYSFLHHLRRAYARRKADESWIAEPLPPSMNASADEFVKAEFRQRDSHLVSHSDSEGFYIPIDFRDVLIDRSGEVPGAMIGSTYCLRDELVFVAPAIGIQLDGERLPDAEADAINLLVTAQKGLFIEKIVWLSLFEAARLSIEFKTAIVFG